MTAVINLRIVFLNCRGLHLVRTCKASQFYPTQTISQLQLDPPPRAHGGPELEVEAGGAADGGWLRRVLGARGPGLLSHYPTFLPLPVTCRLQLAVTTPRPRQSLNTPWANAPRLAQNQTGTCRKLTVMFPLNQDFLEIDQGLLPYWDVPQNEQVLRRNITELETYPKFKRDLFLVDPGIALNHTRTCQKSNWGPRPN